LTPLTALTVLDRCLTVDLVDRCLTVDQGLPFLEPDPEGTSRHITARESCGAPPVTLQRVEKVRDGYSCGASLRASLYGMASRGANSVAVF
jgi:hypothetical protein